MNLVHFTLSFCNGPLKSSLHCLLSCVPSPCGHKESPIVLSGLKKDAVCTVISLAFRHKARKKIYHVVSHNSQLESESNRYRFLFVYFLLGASTNKGHLHQWKLVELALLFYRPSINNIRDMVLDPDRLLASRVVDAQRLGHRSLRERCQYLTGLRVQLQLQTLGDSNTECQTGHSVAVCVGEICHCLDRAHVSWDHVLNIQLNQQSILVQQHHYISQRNQNMG